MVRFKFGDSLNNKGVKYNEIIFFIDFMQYFLPAYFYGTIRNIYQPKKNRSICKKI